jgi:hypothetical protein
VLALAARAAIRPASANRLRSASAAGTGGGEGERGPADATAPALETSSASTSSTSSAASTAASVSCAPLSANAYSRNRPCQVTLNRPSDGVRRHELGTGRDTPVNGAALGAQVRSGNRSSLVLRREATAREREGPASAARASRHWRRGRAALAQPSGEEHSQHHPLERAAEIAYERHCAAAGSRCSGLFGRDVLRVSLIGRWLYLALRGRRALSVATPPWSGPPHCGNAAAHRPRRSGDARRWSTARLRWNDLGHVNGRPRRRCRGARSRAWSQSLACPDRPRRWCSVRERHPIRVWVGHVRSVHRMSICGVVGCSRRLRSLLGCAAGDAWTVVLRGEDAGYHGCELS